MVVEGSISGAPEKKNTIRNVIMLVVAVALGAVGVYLSKDYIEEQIRKSTRVEAPKVPMVSLVVPNRNMMRGEVITPQVLSLRSFPKKYTDSNAVTESSHEIALGQRLAFDIDGGAALLWAHLEGGVSPTFSGKVKSGYRALTLTVDKINSISGFLQPTDHVDLMLTYSDEDPDGEKRQKIRPVIQNLLVLATGNVTDVDKTGGASPRFGTITVEVTPKDAKRITLAQKLGAITAILRNPEDQVPISKVALSENEIFEKKVIVKKKVEKKETGIEFIIGGA